MHNDSIPSITAIGCTSTNAKAPTTFLHPDRVVRSWFPLLASKQIKPGQVLSLDRLNRRLVLWRGQDGAVHVLDARCPHLGADLGQGQVLNNSLRCPFHHWRWGSAGHCVEAPGLDFIPARKTRVYPVQEHWGLIWIFNGPQIEFELPEPTVHGRVLRLPQQYLKCHPHLVIANGIDIAHMRALHGMVFTEQPNWTQQGHRISVEYRGYPGAQWQRRLTRSSSIDVHATNTVIAGSLAWLEVHAPFRFQALFSTQPAPNQTCRTQVIVFLPAQRRNIVPALGLLGVILHADRAVLNRLEFRPGWTALDAPLQAFADCVNAMEVW